MDCCGIVATVFAIVFGVGFAACLVAVIILAVDSSTFGSGKPYVRFDQYEAGVFTYYSEGAFYFYNFKAKEMKLMSSAILRVFSPYKWYEDGYGVWGKVDSRQFSTKHDNSFISCMGVGNHNTCSALTSYDDMSFKISHDAQYIGENNCFEFLDILFFNEDLQSRRLDKCMGFKEGSVESIITTYVESDTGFPVIRKIETPSFSGTQLYIQVFESFKAEKPSDESGLKPFPNVTVYDFRNGKGDAGDGQSNVFDQKSDISSTVKRLFGKETNNNSPNNPLREVKGKEGNGGDNIEKIIENMRINQAVLDRFHILPMRSRESKPASMRETPTVVDVRDIPASFDAREYWSNCKNVIGTITNQELCGSCWAMASSGVVADRLCILNNTNQQQLSPQYMVYCSSGNYGCHGGTTFFTWHDLSLLGTVPESCIPFESHNGLCPNTCKNGEKITNDMLIYAGRSVNYPWGNNSQERVQAIQTEIMTYGSVITRFYTFSDFESFFINNRKGIYHRSVDAIRQSAHFVRIIGWGSEGGVDYWLAANSWGETWGDGGFFKIRRGNNECNFEEEVSATVFN